MAEKEEEPPASPEIDYEPVMKLPLMDLPTLEEEEEDLVKLRAKLYRFDSTEQPGEWKERGTGEIKLLRHKASGAVRVLMRRDKTLKVCANHYIQPHMELQPNADSDRAWIWSSPADFADEEPKPELLAVRFGSAENANKFKAAFEEAKKDMILHLSKQNEEQVISESEEEDSETLQEILYKKILELTVSEEASNITYYTPNEPRTKETKEEPAETTKENPAETKETKEDPEETKEDPAEKTPVADKS